MKQMAVGLKSNLVDRLRKSAIVHLKQAMNRTDGSASRKMNRGTYFPLPVVSKKVPEETSSLMSFALGLRIPPTLRPCSRRYLVRCVDFCTSKVTYDAEMNSSKALLPNWYQPSRYGGGRCTELSVSTLSLEWYTVLLDGDNAAFRARSSFWTGLNAHDALVANKILILISTQAIERLQDLGQWWTVNRAVNACPHTSSRLVPDKRTFYWRA